MAILFAILRIILYVLLVLLALVLILLLLIFFAPYKYRVRALKEPGQMELGATVTGLLHMLALDLNYDPGSGKGLTKDIRIFGISIFELRRKLNDLRMKRSEKKKEKQRREKRKRLERMKTEDPERYEQLRAEALARKREARKKEEERLAKEAAIQEEAERLKREAAEAEKERSGLKEAERLEAEKAEKERSGLDEAERLKIEERKGEAEHLEAKEVEKERGGLKEVERLKTEEAEREGSRLEEADYEEAERVGPGDIEEDAAQQAKENAAGRDAGEAAGDPAETPSVKEKLPDRIARFVAENSPKVLAAIWRILSWIIRFLFKLIPAIWKLPRLLKKKTAGAIRSIADVFSKIAAMRNKAGDIVAFVLDERTQAALGLLKKHLGRLIRHILPRKLVGYVHFGFEDPYLTGRVLAGVCPFYPKYGKTFRVEPDFEQPVIDGDAELKGRVYLFYLAYLVLAVWFNKNTKFVIQYIKSFNKEDSE